MSSCCNHSSCSYWPIRLDNLVLLCTNVFRSLSEANITFQLSKWVNVTVFLVPKCNITFFWQTPAHVKPEKSTGSLPHITDISWVKWPNFFIIFKIMCVTKYQMTQLLLVRNFHCCCFTSSNKRNNCEKNLIPYPTPSSLHPQPCKPLSSSLHPFIPSSLNCVTLIIGMHWVKL